MNSSTEPLGAISEMAWMGLSSRSSTLDPLSRTRSWNATNETSRGRGEDVEGAPGICLVVDYFNLLYVPFIILVGLVGNLLSCLVFLITRLKTRSSSYYLAALATTDFVYVVSLLLVWLNSQVQWEVFDKAGWCQVLIYISTVSSSLSAWLIVAFTVERFIAVQYPLHRPNICTTTTRAKAVVFVLAVFALVFHCYCFYTAGIVKNEANLDTCEMKPDYMLTMIVINVVDSLASLVIPLVLIVVMNIMITYNLHKFSKKFKEGSQGRSWVRSDVNLNKIPSASSCNNGAGVLSMGPGGGRRQPSQQSFHSSKSNHSIGSRHLPATPTATSTPRITRQTLQQQPARCTNMRSSSMHVTSRQITIMLLLVSTMFILLNMPSYGIRLWVFFYTLAGNIPSPTHYCWQQLAMVLYYTNFSINFLLYAICGVTFRLCLKELFVKAVDLTRYHCNPQRYI